MSAKCDKTTNSQPTVGKYFVIRSVCFPELILEINSGNKSPGAPVTTSQPVPVTSYRWQPGDHQLWYLNSETGSICSRLNGYSLDVDGKNQVIVNPNDPDAAGQRWVIYEDHIQTAEDFELVISVNVDEGSQSTAIKSGAQCLVLVDEGAEGQLWKLDHVPMQYFKIRSVHDPQKVLDVKGDDFKPGATLIAYPDKKDLTEKGDNQLWYEDQRGIIRSKLNGFVLDSSGNDSVTLLPYEEKNPQHNWTIKWSSAAGSVWIVNTELNPARALEMKPSNRRSFWPISNPEVAVAAVAIDPGSGTMPSATRTWSIDWAAVGNQTGSQLLREINQQQEQTVGHSGLGKHFVVRHQVSGMVLEMQDVSGRSGTPVVSTLQRMVDLSGHPLQTFYYEDMSSTIRSNVNNYCWDVDDGFLVIKPYDNFSKLQRWKINDNRTITCRQQPNLALTLSPVNPGVKVRVQPNDCTDTQLWDIVHLPAKYFFIVSQMNGKVIDIRGDDVNPGAKVIMYDKKTPAAPNQLWYEDERGIIRSKLNGFVMDSSASGGQIRMQPFSASNTRQFWTIVGDRIQDHYDNGLVLDVSGASTKNGANVIAYKFTGGDNQRWTFEYV